jgi:hypothetical protein
MYEWLPHVYHWSPTERREEILKHGLQLYSEPSHSTESYPYTCFGPTPKAAWKLSGDLEELGDNAGWDLWEVRLPDDAETHIRSEFGPYIYEIRVRTGIPADCVWWVASREGLSAKETT